MTRPSASVTSTMAPGCLQLRIVEQFLRPRDRRIADGRAFADARDLVARQLAEHLAQARQHAVARGDAQRIGGKRRVGREVGEAERLAERPPLRVGDDGDEDLLAVGGVEHVVDAPGRRCASASAPRALPVTANCAMCCETRNALFSNSALVTNWPRPVRARSISAPMMPMTANMPPMMSLTEAPARSGRPGGPVM